MKDNYENADAPRNLNDRSLSSGGRYNAPVPRESNPLTLISPQTPIDRCPTNLNLADPKDAALAVSAVGLADILLDQTGRAVIRAVKYLIYGDWLANEQTGELNPVTWTVLIDNDGRIFKTTSVFGPRAVRAAAELFSAEEWRHGITFEVTTRMTAAKRLAHSFRVSLDQEDAVGPETAKST